MWPPAKSVAINSITSNPLKIFNTELTGNILRVFE